MGGVVTDTNCQRASQSLYETIAVSIFARLPPRALLAASPLARDSCSATFSRGFSSKRETARSLFLGHRSLIKNNTQTAVINIINLRILHKLVPDPLSLSFIWLSKRSLLKCMLTSIRNVKFI